MIKNINQMRISEIKKILLKKGFKVSKIRNKPKYNEIKNIFLTNFIVIAAAILLFTKLIYWYSNKSLQKFTKDTDRKNIFLLRLAFCIFAYITPVYYIFQENSLVVSHYISAITLAIITIFALIGIFIERLLYLKESKKLKS